MNEETPRRRQPQDPERRTVEPGRPDRLRGGCRQAGGLRSVPGAALTAPERPQAGIGTRGAWLIPAKVPARISGDVSQVARRQTRPGDPFQRGQQLRQDREAWRADVRRGLGLATPMKEDSQKPTKITKGRTGPSAPSLPSLPSVKTPGAFSVRAGQREFERG